MKLIKVKQIIAEVVKNSHISSEIKKLVTEDNNLQQSIEEYVNNTETSQEEVEEALNEFPVEDIVNPYEQTLDEMIAEEMEEAKKVFVVNEEEDKCARLEKIIKDLWPYRGTNSNESGALMQTEVEYEKLGCQKQEAAGGEEAGEETPDTGLETADGKRLAVALGKIDNPKELIDFLSLSRQMLSSSDLKSKIKLIAQRAGWENDDITALVRLIRAFETPQ